MNSSDADNEGILQILLSRITPEDRERLRVAWERHAQGDPHSLPAIYALADRFSLTAHAALLARQEELLKSFQEQWCGTSPPARKTTRKLGVRTVGVLCCLAAAIVGGVLARAVPFSSSSADGSDRGMTEEIRAAGAELIHYVSRRDGRRFHVLELRTASPPEAYLTPEHHGVIMFEDKPSFPLSQ